MAFRRLRGRLDHLEGDANQTMAAARALIADLRDGFRVRLKVRITGPLVKFLWALGKALLTGKEPDWAKEFPDGLPLEFDAAVDVDE